VKRSLAAVAALLLAACAKEGAPPPPPAAPAPAAPPTTAAPAARAPAPRRDLAPAPELTLASFRAFTKKKSPEVRRCYEAALANEPSLHGKVTLAFSILPGGGVSEVRVARSTFRSPAVPSCVATVVRSWRTPFRPEEPVDVEYPLDFGPR
jgi:TonB family protein